MPLCYRFRYEDYEAITHQLQEGVGLSLWGRAGQVPQVEEWSAQSPPQGHDVVGGSGDGGVEHGGGGAYGGGGGERGEWHQRELQPPPPGDASHELLPTFRAHQTN